MLIKYRIQSRGRLWWRWRLIIVVVDKNEGTLCSRCNKWPSGFKSSRLESWEACRFLSIVHSTECEAPGKICCSVSSSLLASMDLRTTIEMEIGEQDWKGKTIWINVRRRNAVSYTHLTLPTIYSV